MQPIYSFPPLEPKLCRLLILGSMPGKASLQVQCYYAHPRNAFWPIMAKLLNFDPTLPYAARVEQLKNKGIGLWDVMQSCIRPSSLDADILESSIQTNDFPRWFQQHPDTAAIFCNGGKAYTSYRRHVLPLLSSSAQRLPLVQLPSTSPAYAFLSLAEKTQQWKRLLNYLD